MIELHRIALTVSGIVNPQVSVPHDGRDLLALDAAQGPVRPLLHRAAVSTA